MLEAPSEWGPEQHPAFYAALPYVFMGILNRQGRP